MESDERFERIERTIEFLAQSQARADASQARFEANQAIFDVKMAHLHTDVETLVRVQEGHQVLVEMLLESQRKTEESQRKTDERMRELAEQTKHTDERLNALIKVVDGIITKRPG